MTTEVRRQAVIKNKLGLHARAATKLAKLTYEFDAKVFIEQNGKEVDASSVMCLLLLASAQGHEITVIARGSEAEQAVEAVTALIESRFDEDA